MLRLYILWLLGRCLTFKTFLNKLAYLANNVQLQLLPIAKIRPTSNSIAEIRPNFSLICRTQTLWPDWVELDNHTVERIAYGVNTAGIQTLPPQIILETFPNLWCIPVIYFNAYSRKLAALYNGLNFTKDITGSNLADLRAWLFNPKFGHMITLFGF